jgi:hypothetical protein
MPKSCKKCSGEIPRTIVIEGKKRNLQTRKYCLTCSPFGKHNTAQIHRRDDEGNLQIAVKECKRCGKSHTQKGRKCPTCNFNHRKEMVLSRVQSIVGNACWFCGYSLTWRNLAFHHVDPSQKLFNLSSRECMLRWERIFNEMKKCILVCHNCHGEIHEGLILEDRVQELYKKRWSQDQESPTSQLKNNEKQSFSYR